MFQTQENIKLVYMLNKLCLKNIYEGMCFWTVFIYLFLIIHVSMVAYNALCFSHTTYIPVKLMIGHIFCLSGIQIDETKPGLVHCIAWKLRAPHYLYGSKVYHTFQVQK
jgi:hypothetical protein